MEVEDTLEATEVTPLAADAIREQQAELEVRLAKTVFPLRTQLWMLSQYTKPHPR